MTATQFPFLPGLDLSEALYREAVQPILSRNFPGLATSAALLGSGSEVLGFDTPQSPDHDWGPRLMLFLSETDFPHYHDAVDEALRRELPREIRGYPIDLARRDAGPSGDPAHHHVQILTVRQLFRSVVKIDVEQEITPLDWVLVPQQQLRSLTAGRVFDDGLGQLERARAKLAYYPHDVWLYLLAAQWMRISQEEHFMGRTGQAGDEIGSRLVAGRLVKDLMNLGFLMERQYAPYIKWFGTAFSRLDCARDFNPLFEQVFTAPTWQARQPPLARMLETAAHLHNRLAITPPLPEQAEPFYNRPFLVIWGERFFETIHAQIHDPRVLALPPRLGGVDQYLDSTDAINFLNEELDEIKKTWGFFFVASQQKWGF
jgi:hypothetical protein